MFETADSKTKRVAECVRGPLFVLWARRARVSPCRGRNDVGANCIGPVSQVYIISERASKMFILYFRDPNESRLLRTRRARTQRNQEISRFRGSSEEQKSNESSALVSDRTQNRSQSDRSHCFADSFLTQQQQVVLLLSLPVSPSLVSKTTKQTQIHHHHHHHHAPSRPQSTGPCSHAAVDVPGTFQQRL